MNTLRGVQCNRSEFECKKITDNVRLIKYGNQRATAADIDAISRVAKLSWKADYPDIFNREAIKEGVHEWYDYEQIASELEEDDVILLVREIDDQVVGFSHAVRLQRTGFIL